MGKRGPKPERAEVVELRGTDKPSRARGQLGTDDVGYVPPKPPTWLPAPAKRIWRAKVAEYERRGQRIQGFEQMLGHYCALEADIIDDRKHRRPVPASAMGNLLKFAALFYDTPADTVQAGGEATPKKGAFSDRGRR